MPQTAPTQTVQRNQAGQRYRYQGQAVARRTVQPTRPGRRYGQRPIRPRRTVLMPGPWNSLRPYALKLLKYDHKRMRRLLHDLEKAKTGGDRTMTFGALEWEIAMHSRLEHEIFYAQYRKACRKDKQRKLFHEATEEHETIDRMLDDLRDCDIESVRFAGRAKALRAALRQHMRAEERHLFPQARRVLGRHNLKGIGRAMQDRRRMLTRNPS